MKMGKLETQVFSRDFDDSLWREVAIPHDWGIEGDFDIANDPSVRSIVQDGIKVAIPQTGRTGGLPTVGEGVYRTWVNIDDPVEVAVLELDGVMWESNVYVNGKRAGGCHFGYLSFEVDITDLVVSGKNLIAIHATVPPESSRWYSGGGLYRNIRLITKPRAHITYNGVWVRQIYANEKSALFDISVTAENSIGFSARITTPSGETHQLSTKDDKLSFLDEKPMLWDVNCPNLYTAEIEVEGGDSVSVRFGARECEVTKNGFFLNGRYLKLNGVCMHHDKKALSGKLVCCLRSSGEVGEVTVS